MFGIDDDVVDRPDDDDDGVHAGFGFAVTTEGTAGTTLEAMPPQSISRSTCAGDVEGILEAVPPQYGHMYPQRGTNSHWKALPQNPNPHTEKLPQEPGVIFQNYWGLIPWRHPWVVIHS